MWTWLILHTLSAVALAAVALALGRWLRLGPAARHALWLVVLLKLLTPPVVSWPWSVPVALPGPTAPGAGRPEPTPPTETQTADTGVPAVFEFVRAPVAETPALETGPSAEPHLSADVWSVVAGGIWLAGGVFVAGRELLRAWRIRRLLEHARPAPPELVTVAQGLAGAMNMSLPRLAVLPGLGSPVIWALGPARLLWPAGLEEGLPSEGLRAVLTHELAHLRRRDHWVGWLVLAAGCLWWWHPLFWLVRRRLHREAELACDAWVVARLPAARRAYAEALLLVCQRWSAPAAAPALGAAGQRRDLERRLIMVMGESVPYRLTLRWVLGVGALAVLGIPTLTSGQQPDKTEKPAFNVVTVAEDPAGDREQRIRELEGKVEALLREIQALRGGQPKHAQPGEKHAPKTAGATEQHASKTGRATFEFSRQPYRVEVPITSGGGSVLWRTPTDKGGEPGGPINEVTLIRATYKLKQAQAEALGKFLSDNVKASVMETKVDGESVIVTTTPEAQRVVMQIIALMQGKVPGGRTYYWQPGAPAKEMAK
jgi:beta-lactamase regulating signal transducer with metallopeptidase domain